MRVKAGMAVLAMLLIAASALGETDHKPRRGKHYLPAGKVGTTTTEELGDEKVVEEKSYIDRLKGDRRLAPWEEWWRRCDRSFSVDALVDAGVVSLDDEWQAYDKSELEGPNREFLSSKGGKTVNPVWGRMRYVKQDKLWQAQMTNARCGVMMYDGGRAKKLVHCGELDGVFGGFWFDGSKYVVMAYRKISPEMNAECMAKEIGECVAAILWLIDLKDDSAWEYRGPVVTFKECEPNDLLVKLYPEFFVQEQTMQGKAAGN